MPPGVATLVTMRTTVIALLALAAMPAAAGAAPWSAPRAVTASGLAREPAVALGGPDAAAVAYVRHPPAPIASSCVAGRSTALAHRRSSTATPATASTPPP